MISSTTAEINNSSHRCISERRAKVLSADSTDDSILTKYLSKHSIRHTVKDLIAVGFDIYDTEFSILCGIFDTEFLKDSR